MLLKGSASLAPSTTSTALPAAYLQLSKTRLVALVLITTAAGVVLGSNGRTDWTLLLVTVLGTGLAAAGANAFNQWLEVEPDSLMRRTCLRPLPGRRLSSAHAFWWALSVSVAGLLLLLLCVNALTALLGLIVELLYVLGYTPLKKRSSLCTLAGAVCGALPPLMGWAAVTGALASAAWVLGALLFVWQIPHFLALGWLHRDDYARAGFRVLPVIDPAGRSTRHFALLYSLALLPFALALPLSGLGGWLCLSGALFAGAGMVVASVCFYRAPTATNARRLFVASLVYLPIVFAAMLLDRF